MTSRVRLGMASPGSDSSDNLELTDFFAATFSPSIVDDRGGECEEEGKQVEEAGIGLEPYRFEPQSVKVQTLSPAAAVMERQLMATLVGYKIGNGEHLVPILGPVISCSKSLVVGNAECGVDQGATG